MYGLFFLHALLFEPEDIDGCPDEERVDVTWSRTGKSEDHGLAGFQGALSHQPNDPTEQSVGSTDVISENILLSVVPVGHLHTDNR